MPVRWQGGINEFRGDIDQLPETATREAILLITKTAHDAAEELRQIYPLGETGQLRDGVNVVEQHDEAARIARVWVENKAWYSMIYEYGSQTRKTRTGTPNPLPAGKKFIPTMEKYRRRLFGDSLRLMLLAQGAVRVRDDAA